MVKHLPTMWETGVRSLGQEDPLEKGMGIHSSILVWEIPSATVHGVAQSWTRLKRLSSSSSKKNKREDNVLYLGDEAGDIL